MVKKIIFILGILFFGIISLALTATTDMLPGAMSATQITSTTSAGTFVKLTSSESHQTDSAGVDYIARAFEFYEDTGTYDIRYAWSSNSSTYAVWKMSWGPYQTNMVPPASGVYVALTFTPGSGDTITIRYDNKR
jgi:hypothetical protein